MSEGPGGMGLRVWGVGFFVSEGLCVGVCSV